jgi:tetratricopeptide (TPR) repeat protein
MLGRLPEAGTDLAKALRIEPRLPQAWSNRGKLFLKLQQPEAALAAFEKAMALRPGYVEALSGRAVALKYLGRFETALEGFDAALACDPPRLTPTTTKRHFCYFARISSEASNFTNIAGSFPGCRSMRSTILSRSGKGTIRTVAASPFLTSRDTATRSNSRAIFLILAGQGANVTFFCRKSLRRLLKGLDGQIKIANDADANERFDYQTALSSLLRAFKTRLATIPATLFLFKRRGALAAKMGGADRLTWFSRSACAGE